MKFYREIDPTPASQRVLANECGFFSDELRLQMTEPMAVELAISSQILEIFVISSSNFLNLISSPAEEERKQDSEELGKADSEEGPVINGLPLLQTEFHEVEMGGASF
ncbi:hypothetical protein NE237_025964 [Protea cynaroides]|uniref:Uncharacterized protein n=1 Tax=Protea cynaroides TaxID=273540 RepID=A0A9Q0H5U0_9MAGN|nr:hypothetical protein NE237_025964 [Protea cynaroides]